MTSVNEKVLHTSAGIFDAFIERSWRSNAERQKAKGAEFVIGKREGVYMWDIEGKRRLIDCGTGGGVHALGHRHPEVLAALRQALDDGRDTGLWSVPNAEYLKLQDKLAALAPKPHLNRSVVTLCSTLSVDLATMFAFRVTKRQKMLAYRHGYHGHTGFAAIVTGSPEEGIIDHYNLPSHSNFLERFGDIEELDRLLTSEIAGFIIEPMDYETFEAAPKAFFARASRLCKERGVLFIVDETRTGLGRSGTLWASEQYDIDPDMMITGKGLSGGLYPASAVLMREEIYEQCMNQHRFAYISSLGGNEISCVVAAKVLEVASSPALLDNVRNVGAYLHDAFDALCAKHSDILKGVTSFGLAVSVQVIHRDAGRELYKKILADGVLCHSVAEIDPPGLKFFPPLVLTKTEADQIVNALDRAASSLPRAAKPAA